MSSTQDDAIPVEAIASADQVAVKSAEIAFEDYFKHSHTSSEHRVNDALKHVGKGGVAKRASVFSGSPSPAKINSPGTKASASPATPTRRQSTFANKIASSTGVGDKCKRCNKTVYQVEKMTSTEGIFHKSCFSCGLDSGNGCKRTLDLTSYEVYGGIIFCKTCSKKQFFGDKQMKTSIGGTLSPLGTGTGNLERRSSQGKESPSVERRASLGENETSTPSAPAPSLMSVFGTVSFNEAEELEEEQQEATTAESETAQSIEETEAQIEEAEVQAEEAEQQAEQAEQQTEGAEEQVEEAKGQAGALAEEECEEEEEEGEDKFDESAIAAPSALAPATPNVEPAPIQRTFHECPYTSPFDKNGAIYWVGSAGGTAEYENPQRTGMLYLEISTLYRGQLFNLTSYQAADTAAERIAAATYTNNTSRSWLVVDFGPERKLRPSYYCLKHGASGIGNAIRNWTLEAKVEEDSPWIEIRKHVNDVTMREEPQSVAGYELTSDACKNNFFRIFRITQTGKNSGGNDCLFIGAIDFYGIMRVEKGAY